MNQRTTSTSPVQKFLEQLHRDCAKLNGGNVATYIPELAKANPDWFGISIVTPTGSVYEVGDSAQPFTIQSISKPFVYGMALEDNGRSDVSKKVGVEPTGDLFNSISLEPGTGRPRNPMINAGAIATAGLIAGKTLNARFKRVLDTFGLYAGRELGLDESVYRSESDTGHRNRAIGHMLRNFDILTSDPLPVTELYFMQCSISVTCRDLAVMAATLANRGVNPITGKQAIRAEYVESLLSVMGTCGMYDYAGEWIYNVGMPAKSGVGGGIIAVLPGQLGIGVFSPPLDAHGNSVRGIRVCQELSRRLDLHLLNRPSVGRWTIRSKFTGAQFNSSRVRPAHETEILRADGKHIGVWQLQGNLMFSTAEVVMHDVLAHLDSNEFVILDLKRTLSANESACGLLHQLLMELSQLGKKLLFVRADRAPSLRRVLKMKLGDRFENEFLAFDDLDVALEWCEDRLVERANANLIEKTIPLEDFAIANDLTDDELNALKPLLKTRSYRTGENIINAGDRAGELYLLTRGKASVLITVDADAKKRLATVSAGVAFGEMALIDRQPRSAMVVADRETECLLLTLEDFEQLTETQPAIKIKLLQNLCLDLTGKLRKANRELQVFD
jgi:glutaminase